MPFLLRVMVLVVFLLVVFFVLLPRSVERMRSMQTARKATTVRRNDRAASLGLRRTSGRPGLVDTRFELFTRDDEQTYGTGYERRTDADGSTAVVFDYAHGTTWYDRDEGREVSDFTRYTVVVQRVRFTAPVTVITTENLRSRLGRLVGDRDIEIESDRFNRRFRIEGADERFAVMLLDPRVAGLMTEEGGAELCERVELRDDKVVFVADRLDGTEMFDFFEWTDRWIERLPPLLADDYPLTG